MKIAISSTGRGMESSVDARFGRCPYFILADIENGRVKGTETIENTSAKQMGGAGITAAELVAEKGVKAVITVNMGPRAFSVFQQLGIEVYRGEGRVKDVIRKFAKGELKSMSGPECPKSPDEQCK